MLETLLETLAAGSCWAGFSANTDPLPSMHRETRGLLEGIGSPDYGVLGSVVLTCSPRE